MYYSLKYLSLSDATVLTFLAPLFTGVSGAIFLKEKFSKREALAGREHLTMSSLATKCLTSASVQFLRSLAHRAAAVSVRRRFKCHTAGYDRRGGPDQC